MSSENFCNWLQGYLELANPSEIREKEILIIKDHLEESQKYGRPYYSTSNHTKEELEKVRPTYC